MRKKPPIETRTIEIIQISEVRFIHLADLPLAMHIIVGNAKATSTQVSFLSSA